MTRDEKRKVKILFVRLLHSLMCSSWSIRLGLEWPRVTISLSISAFTVSDEGALDLRKKTRELPDRPIESFRRIEAELLRNLWERRALIKRTECRPKLLLRVVRGEGGKFGLVMSISPSNAPSLRRWRSAFEEGTKWRKGLVYGLRCRLRRTKRIAREIITMRRNGTTTETVTVPEFVASVIFIRDWRGREKGELLRASTVEHKSLAWFFSMIFL